MGDPRPGQIVDNIFVSIQQQFIDTNVVSSKGVILVRTGTSDTWKPASGVANETDAGIEQSRTDIDTTGLSVGAITVETFSSPSQIYAIAGGTLKPNDPVKLDSSGQKFILFVQGTDSERLKIGRYSRKSADSAGNNQSIDDDVFVLKLGVI